MNKIKPLILVAVGLMLFGRAPGPGPQPLPTPNAGGEIFLYRATEKCKPGYYPLDQGAIGSCVAVGHKGAADGTTAVRVLRGDLKKFVECSAESIYGGARNEGQGRISGSRSDGSNGWAAVAWLTKVGGLVYQQPYEKYGIDLSTYDIKRCKEWGAFGNGGKADGRSIPGPLDKEAALNPLPGAAKVRTLKELDAALDRLCFVTICSDVGFNSPRDKDGFCAPRGSWGHCMHITARRNGGRPGYLIQNSWNAYIRGDGIDSPNKYQDQPDGSFYAEPRDVARILAAGDSWALSADPDFKAGDVPQWLTTAHARAPEPDEVAEVAEPKRAPPLIAVPDSISTLLKPMRMEDFEGLSKETSNIPKQEVRTFESASKVVSKVGSNLGCANGSCSMPTRRRWFR